jgi:hypothetical protein
MPDFSVYRMYLSRPPLSIRKLPPAKVSFAPVGLVPIPILPLAFSRMDEFVSVVAVENLGT